MSVPDSPVSSIAGRVSLVAAAELWRSSCSIEVRAGVKPTPYGEIMMGPALFALAYPGNAGVQIKERQRV